MYFKASQKVIYYLGYFWEKICCQELSKIAQSGHTDHKARLPNAIIKILKIFFPHNTPIYCFLLSKKLSDLLGTYGGLIWILTSFYIKRMQKEE